MPTHAISPNSPLQLSVAPGKLISLSVAGAAAVRLLFNSSSGAQDQTLAPGQSAQLQSVDGVISISGGPATVTVSTGPSPTASVVALGFPDGEAVSNSRPLPTTSEATDLGIVNHDDEAPVSGDPPINLLGDGIATSEGCKGVRVVTNSIDYGVWIVPTRTDEAPDIDSTHRFMRIPSNDSDTVPISGAGWYVWAVSEDATYPVPVSVFELL